MQPRARGQHSQAAAECGPVWRLLPHRTERSVAPGLPQGHAPTLCLGGGDAGGLAALATWSIPPAQTRAWTTLEYRKENRHRRRVRDGDIAFGSLDNRAIQGIQEKGSATAVSGRPLLSKPE